MEDRVELPEELPDFPDGGLEGHVAHQDLASRLFLLRLLFLVRHLSRPGNKEVAVLSQDSNHTYGICTILLIVTVNFK